MITVFMPNGEKETRGLTNQETKAFEKWRKENVDIIPHNPFPPNPEERISELENEIALLKRCVEKGMTF